MDYYYSLLAQATLRERLAVAERERLAQSALEDQARGVRGRWNLIEPLLLAAGAVIAFAAAYHGIPGFAVPVG